MESALKELIESPNLQLYVNEMVAIINKEHRMRIEFYNKISEKDKAEFINGEAVFHSPVKLMHNNASTNLMQLMKVFAQMEGLGIVGHEKLMVEFTRNSYEPDIVFFKKEKSKNFKRDQLIFPVPDFIVEVLSPSTIKIDREIKFKDYEAHGVQEYWIINPDKQTVEQYILSGKSYELIMKGKNGIIESKAIRGFKIPVKSIFNEKENLETLQQLIASSTKKRK